MAVTLGRLGPKKALALFADWTDRIAAGELPSTKPQRPQGVERNVVISMWDWATPKAYLHDEISTDKRNPRVNANGLIYGSPEESTDMVPVLESDHERDLADQASLSRPGHALVARTIRMGTRRIGATSRSGTATPPSTIRCSTKRGACGSPRAFAAPQNPAYCKAGSDLPSAQGRAAQTFGAPALDVRSEDRKVYADRHLLQHPASEFRPRRQQHAVDQRRRPGERRGRLAEHEDVPDETGDAEKSQGWTPLIIDTNGNGKRDDVRRGRTSRSIPRRTSASWRRFMALQPSPVDDSIWGQSMDVGFSRMDQPGYVVRLVPGAESAGDRAGRRSTSRRISDFGSRGIDLDLNGVVWTALSSGHLASFDRRKCKGPLNGPPPPPASNAPKAGRCIRFPGPQFKGVTDPGSADHAYFVWVDHYNTLGLGANVPIAEANGSEALLALVNGKFVDMRIPYPMGFFSKNVDGRIDDPNAGWKGRGLWTTTGTRTVFHNEGGTASRPKVYKVQLRPDPLAR